MEELSEENEGWTRKKLKEKFGVTNAEIVAEDSERGEGGILQREGKRGRAIEYTPESVEKFVDELVEEEEEFEAKESSSKEKEMIRKAVVRELEANQYNKLKPRRKKKDEELKPFVKEHQTSKDKKGNPVWKVPGQVEVKLRPYRRFDYPIEEFVQKLAEKSSLQRAFKEMFKFYSIKKKAVDDAVEDSENDFPLTEADLREIREKRIDTETVSVDILLSDEKIERIRQEEPSLLPEEL